jgi:hypothetical protein
MMQINGLPQGSQLPLHHQITKNVAKKSEKND